MLAGWWALSRQAIVEGTLGGVLILRKGNGETAPATGSHASHRSKSLRTAHLYRVPTIGSTKQTSHWMPVCTAGPLASWSVEASSMLAGWWALSRQATVEGTVGGVLILRKGNGESAPATGSHASHRSKSLRTAHLYRVPTIGFTKQASQPMPVCTAGPLASWGVAEAEAGVAAGALSADTTDDWAGATGTAPLVLVEAGSTVEVSSMLAGW